MLQEFKIATYNIRLDDPEDGINAWPFRRDRVVSLLTSADADIFGLQEALIGQVNDISERMPGFGWLGSGRDDGRDSGEYNPVFFRRGKFRLISTGQFWLSETPEIPGRGWDAAFNRICTWGKFMAITSGKLFFYLNTHLDHVGPLARTNSAMLILEKIRQLKDAEELPVILTGDFNLTPETEPILLLKKRLFDAREVTEAEPSGPEGTFNNFRQDHPLDRRIDFVFVNDQLKVKEYAVLPDARGDHYPSDHLPVVVKVC